MAEYVRKAGEGDVTAWHKFSKLSEDTILDGENSVTYSIACAELARRDPAIFLRRHINGDKYAIVLAERAFGWLGHEGRSAINWHHFTRLRLAADPIERKVIQDFIDGLNKSQGEQAAPRNR